MAFPWKGKMVIIATKGLPVTGTLYMCSQISRWEKCPVLGLDAILEELYEQGGYNATRRPSKEEEEEEGLQRLAFSLVCRVAGNQMSLLRSKIKCVDRLFHLDQLIQLSRQNIEQGEDPHKIIILEIRFRHKYLWKNFAKKCIAELDTTKRWYLPRSWNEIEKAIVDYDVEAWDKYYDNKCVQGDHIKRLVLDPILDIDIDELESEKKTSLFGKAIEHLLNDQEAPSIVNYRAWRKKLVEGLALSEDNPINNGIRLCSNNGSDCVFVKSKKDNNKCKACEKDSSYYKCITCSQALCKSCAEVTARRRIPRIHTGAFKSCSDGGKYYTDDCGSCRFESDLKYSRVVSSLVDNPLLHPHLLSLEYMSQPFNGMYFCELCSFGAEESRYYCVICNYSYHPRCVLSPLQLKHCHGGHKHLLNLVLPPPEKDEVAFSRDDYLDPDDLWCEVCYKDMDSHAGFYSCQDCPEYVAHLTCISKQWN